MADNENASGDPQDVTKGSGGVAALVETVEKMNDSLEKIGEKQTELEKGLQEATKVQYPYGPPNGDVHGIRKGEDPMTSRPYSLTMVCKRLAMQRSNEPNWQHIARPEAELSEKLRKAYYNSSAFNNFLIPLGSDLMPIEERTTDDGVVVPGVPKELRKECADMMRLDSDPDLEYLQRLGLPIRKSHVALQKDLSANTATTGGTLVAAAAQGELINVLRAQEFFSQVGAQQMGLPPQGAITFPRVTGSVTISAFAEAATVTESTPATSQLRLAAKAYSGTGRYSGRADQVRLGQRRGVAP